MQERREENKVCSHEDLREEIRKIAAEQQANNDATGQMHMALFGDEITRQKGLIEKFDELKESLDPIVEAFRDDKGFWTKVGTYAKYVGWGAAILVAIKMLGGDIIKIFGK